MSLISKLSWVQKNLKAPKSQYNSFGKYHYRSCEDILTAVKGLLEEQDLLLTITDEVVRVGDRYYLKSTAKVTHFDDEKSVEVSAYAREAENRKGMDDSQITGATSSYARKYALNGLFAIDDQKDADTPAPKDKPIDKPNTDKPGNPGLQSAVEKPAPTKKNPDPKKIDNNQLKRIIDATEFLGMQPDQAKEIIKDKYKVESSKELTWEQAEDFLKYLSNLKGGEK